MRTGTDARSEQTCSTRASVNQACAQLSPSMCLPRLEIYKLDIKNRYRRRVLPLTRKRQTTENEPFVIRVPLLSSFRPKIPLLFLFCRKCRLVFTPAILHTCCRTTSAHRTKHLPTGRDHSFLGLSTFARRESLKTAVILLSRARTARPRG